MHLPLFVCFPWSCLYPEFLPGVHSLNVLILFLRAVIFQVNIKKDWNGVSLKKDWWFLDNKEITFSS